MRSDIHPDYHPVVFRDAITGDQFLTRSTATSSTTVQWSDGRSYPLITVETSAMIQVASPSRERVESYIQLREQIEGYLDFGGEHAAQARGVVGDDAVDAEPELRAHVLRRSDGPHDEGGEYTRPWRISVLPTQRTAEVETRRWSMSCTA